MKKILRLILAIVAFFPPFLPFTLIYGMLKSGTYNDEMHAKIAPYKVNNDVYYNN